MRHLARLIIPLFAVCLSIGSTVAIASDLASIFENIPRDMEAAHVPGLTLAVIEDGRISHQMAFGIRSIEDKTPVTTDDVFEAASNGKMIAAAHLFSLLQNGELQLTDTVDDDRIVSACGAVTLAEILSHTAGLSNAIHAAQFVVDCELRGHFSYAGEGYVALESVFQQILDEPSHKAIEAGLFQPLGMTYSTLDQSAMPMVAGHPDLVFGILTGRANQQNRVLAWAFIIASGVLWLLFCYLMYRRLRLIYFLFLTPMAFSLMLVVLLIMGTQKQIAVESLNAKNDIASTLKINVTDLAKFAVELINPTLMSVRTRDMMLQPQTTVNSRVKWGYGIGIDESDGATTYWHWGSNPGYQSLFVIYPDENKGIVILTNGGGFADYLLADRGGYYLARKIARQILGVDGHWMTSDPESES